MTRHETAAASRGSRGSREPVGWRLTRRQQCDYEMLASGGFAPLRSFLGREDHASVCERMRLTDGTVWPVPVMLDVPETVLRAAERSGSLVLRGADGGDLAVLTVTEAWRPDRVAEAAAVAGTTDPSHPWVRHLLEGTHEWYVTGDLSVLRLPSHPDLPPLVRTPAQLREEISSRGWSRVVAFNTRNPMHGAHRALALRAAAAEDACLLIHPVVGPTRPGDVPAHVRVRCYEAVMRTLDPDRSLLSLLPLAMRMVGPREALLHAIIRRTYGATAFVVGRDHAGPGRDAAGRPFYAEYASQELVGSFQDELGIRMVAGRELLYVDELGYVPREEVPPGRTGRAVSGTQVRQLLAEGATIPPWLAPPEVAAELARALAS